MPVYPGKLLRIYYEMRSRGPDGVPSRERLARLRIEVDHA